MLLTGGDELPPATAAYLAGHPSARRWALGGPAAAADPAATPLVGTDRYDTAARVAAALFPAPPRVGAASSAGYPDALAGGAHIGASGAPLVLVPPSGPLPASVQGYLRAHATTISRGFVYGGPVAVGDDVLAALQRAITA